MTSLDLLMIVAVAATFWLLILRPAKARRAAQTALVAALVPGRRIMTTAGLFGTVVSVEPGLLRVELAPGVVVEMVPEAVGRVVDAADAVDPAGPGDVAPHQGGTSDSPEARGDALPAGADSASRAEGLGPTRAPAEVDSVVAPAGEDGVSGEREADRG